MNFPVTAASASRSRVSGRSFTYAPNAAGGMRESLRAGDVRYETDFRSVYARVLDQWLGNADTEEHWRDVMLKVTGPLAEIGMVAA